MPTSNVPGHVFVVQAHLQDIAADAVLIPTDTSFQVESYWLPALGGNTVARKPKGWGPGAIKRNGAGGYAWFIDVTDNDRIEKPGNLLPRVREALTQMADAVGVQKSATKRPRAVLALPLIGTRGGGLPGGEMVASLFDHLRAVARDKSVDIAVVVPNRRRFEALQYQRRKNVPDSPHRELAERLGCHARNGHLSLMLGAGVSAGAGLPDWSTLIEKLGGRVKDEAHRLHETDAFKRLAPWDQAQLLEQLLGEDYAPAIVEAVGDTPDSPRKPALAHFLLAGLRCRQAATTNYDLLYETAAASQLEASGRPTTRPAALPYERPVHDQAWILKLHGDVNHPDDLVLSRRSFVTYDAKHRAAGSLLQAMLMTSHVLFVGASMNDDNVLRLTHEVSALMPAAKLGTVLSLGTDDVRKTLWEKEFHWEGIEAPVDVPEEDLISWQARELEILLDSVAMWAISEDDLFLDPDLDALWSPEELEAARHVRAWVAFRQGRDKVTEAARHTVAATNGE